MTLVLLCARLLLALVFIVAGLAKLADLAGSRQAMRDFGVPAGLALPFGTLLPLAELAVAVALVLAISAWWGALGALVLLLLFVGGISYNLARGRQPDCHCFGQLHSAPAGWPTLIRNLVLAAIAVVVVALGRSTPELGVFDWLGPLTIPQRTLVLVGVIVLTLLIGEGWVLFQIMSQQGRLLLRIEALEARWTEAGGAAVPQPAVPAAGLTHVLLQKDREVAQAYQANGTPSAVLVHRDGTLGSPLAQGADAIRALIATALNPTGPGTLPIAANQRNGNGAAAAARPPVGPRIGEPAPGFSLPDLAGQTVSLADFRGDRTLLLFWRPSCGFCQRMLPDLKTWEEQPSKGAPRLLVVSTDSVADNQAMGLRSPVVLDQDGMRVGGLFGATGTPMAVLVDEEGKIASEVAAGAPAVLALAGQDTSARASN